MNYRHSYHAGNFADVFKHSILVLIVQKLLAKNTPFCYLDTHAGIGCYDLTGNKPQKTKEYRSGITKIMAAKNPPSDLTAYIDLIKKLNTKEEGLRFYPGSPFVVHSMLRTQDRMVLLELHQEDAQILKQNFFKSNQVAIHHYDGYLGLKAFLPPKENRGLVLIDAPFEAKDEFTTIINGMKIALERWNNGIYAIWYPIKERNTVNEFTKELQKLSPKEILISEITVGKATEKTPFVSCGMAIVNPPWQLKQQLAQTIPWLKMILSQVSKLN